PFPLVIWPAFTVLLFLIPWIPFFVFFVVVGVAWIAESLRPPALAAIPLVVVAAVLFASYAWGLANSSYGPYLQVDAPAAVATFAFIRTQTPASSILLVAEPRAFALFTGRRSTSLSVDRTPASTLLAYADSIHATYMVIGQWHRAPYNHLFAAYSDRFRLVFRKGPFVVMELLAPR